MSSSQDLSSSCRNKEKKSILLLRYIVSVFLLIQIIKGIKYKKMTPPPRSQFKIPFEVAIPLKHFLRVWQSSQT